MDFDGGTMSAEEFLRLFGDNFEFLTDIKLPAAVMNDVTNFKDTEYKPTAKKSKPTFPSQHV